MAAIGAPDEFAIELAIEALEPDDLLADARRPWVTPQVTSRDVNDAEFSPSGPGVDASLFS